MSVETAWAIFVWTIVIIFMLGIYGIYDLITCLLYRRNGYRGKLRLVYRHDEPLFKQNRKFARAVKIQFHDNKGRAFPSMIALKNDGSGGWTAQLESRAKYPRKIGLKNPKDVDVLVGRINSALQQHQEFDLGSEVAQWRVFVETGGCTVELYSDLSNIVPPLDTLPSDHVVLVFQNGLPVFFQNNQIGHQVVAFFGECRSGDYYPVARHSIVIKLAGTGWHVVANAPDINDRCESYDTSWLDGSDESVSPYNDCIAKHFLEQEEKVAELAADCNRAIQNGERFDFAEYMHYWRQWDKHFGIFVVANSLFVE